MSPPVPWVAPVLYVGVLIAGGYAGLAGLGETRPALFLGGLLAATALDMLERHRYPAGVPRRPAAALLATRFVLFVIIAAGDGSGMSRVLFLLLPFTAYFALGRTISIVVGITCVGFVATVFQLTVPEWYRQTEQVSDLLMFAVGLVLTIAMAAVAANERLARTQLQQANEILLTSSAQLAELSATAERNRLARDIHDGLGHHLTAIAVLLEKAATFRDRDAAAADTAVENARRSARHALEDVRRSVTTLSGETAPFRLAHALDDLIREGDDGRLSVTVDWRGDENRLEPAALMALYRAAQEGLTNVRRHANATKATVSVDCDPAGAHLVVTDDGRGFTPEQEGFGLRGMRERVRLIGGSVTVDSRPGGGTRLAVAIPNRAAS